MSSLSSVRKLREEARYMAKLRGHELGRFASLSDTRSTAWCRRCDAAACVNAAPAPNNEIDLSGEAFAVDCWEMRAAGR